MVCVPTVHVVMVKNPNGQRRSRKPLRRVAFSEITTCIDGFPCGAAFSSGPPLGQLIPIHPNTHKVVSRGFISMSSLCSKRSMLSNVLQCKNRTGSIAPYIDNRNISRATQDRFSDFL
jgi:hypothetical protein